jgi:hypothetical protein
MIPFCRKFLLLNEGEQIRTDPVLKRRGVERREVESTVGYCLLLMVKGRLDPYVASFAISLFYRSKMHFLSIK